MLQGIIVDDCKVSLRVIRKLLEKSQAIQIVGVFDDSAAALREFSRLRPDVAFLDIEMPGVNGLRLAEKFTAIERDVAIVFISSHRDYALDAFRVHAAGYITKPINADQLQQTVEHLLHRQFSLERVKRKESSQISCFGEFSVYGPKQAAPVHWRTAKAQELFAFFLQHCGREVPKWKIIEALWPDGDDEKCNGYLHTSVYNLKQGLKKAGIKFSLRFQNDCYRLELADALIDSQEFTRIYRQISLEPQNYPEEAEQALAIYKGPYLESKGYSWSIPLQEEFALMQAKLLKSLEARAEGEKPLP